MPSPGIHRGHFILGRICHFILSLTRRICSIIRGSGLERPPYLHPAATRPISSPFTSIAAKPKYWVGSQRGNMAGNSRNSARYFTAVAKIDRGRVEAK
jgi:hypothetical protein